MVLAAAAVREVVAAAAVTVVVAAAATAEELIITSIRNEAPRQPFAPFPLRRSRRPSKASMGMDNIASFLIFVTISTAAAAAAAAASMSMDNGGSHLAAPVRFHNVGAVAVLCGDAREGQHLVGQDPAVWMEGVFLREEPAHAV